MLKKATLLLAILALVASCGADQTADRDTHLRLLQWQAPSHLNPWLSSGTKDLLPASLVLEPLANWSPDGELVPTLAAEIPTLDNGGLAPDLRSVTWKLRPDVKWSDGTPFTAADAVFTWEYCLTEGSGCSGTSSFANVSDLIALDSHTLRIEFDGPTPFPYVAFVSYESPLLQQNQFAECLGTEAASCTEQNWYPIGTGPFRVVDFRVDDLVLLESNQHYRGDPHFRSIEVKGGGSATDTAREVLQTGEADFAWNLQLPPNVIAEMLEAGHGYQLTAFSANTEHLVLNQTNPEPPGSSDFLGGSNPHPLLAVDPRLTRALSLAIDRPGLVASVYGDTGTATCDIWNGPGSSRSDWCLQPDLEAAQDILDSIGAIDHDGDGIRELNGRTLSFDFVAPASQVRQDTQALIQDAWRRIGVEVHVRSVPPDQYFSPGISSPDSMWRFDSDVAMFSTPPRSTDPEVYLGAYASNQIPESANAWSGGNIPRFASTQFDQVLTELSQTADLARRHQLSRQLDQMLVESGAVIPLVFRGSVSAFANSVQGVGELNGWDSLFWNIEDWFRQPD